MSAAHELVRTAVAAGATLTARGDRLRIAAPRPLAPELLDELRRMNPAVLAALADWRARHREALTYWGAPHPAGRGRTAQDYCAGFIAAVARHARRCCPIHQGS